MTKESLVKKSIGYILEHLEDSITVAEIADYLFLSKYYFSRIFKEIVGESVYSFVKRLKIEQSAIDIKLQKDKLLTDIGLNYGYSSNNYSTAFKEYYHLSPTEFKKSSDKQTVLNPFDSQRIERLRTYKTFEKKVQIIEKTDFYVLFERTVGNYYDIKNNWHSFLERNKEYYHAETILVEKFYSDPALTTYPNNVYDLCLVVDEKMTSQENVMRIQGGLYAIYSFCGEIQNIFFELQSFFSVWLAQSNYVMRSNFGFTIYHEINWQTERVSVDFYIPIQ
ncbi:AraC family transcriptional regulator [Enterococcus sp. AZ194]|uniref:AraC family transcriptional regulator n=1 Tax=Enterococcus sp. AZ194 TaxID=2774629 RepID=UPI003F213949